MENRVTRIFWHWWAQLITIAVLATRLRAQVIASRSVVRGTVTDPEHRPIAEALVVRNGTRADSVRTDSTGRFRLTSVARGVSTFTVRRLGFAPYGFEVEFLSDTTVDVNIELEPAPIALDAIDVREVRGPFFELLTRAGFEERRRQAERSAIDATFLTPEQIAARRSSQFSQLMEGQRSIHIRYERSIFAIPYGRDGRCVMNVWVDGHEMRDLFTRASPTGLNFIEVGQVAAVEIYPSPTGTPPQFQNLTGNCGAIVIWTKP